jgi:hypothetical protein
MRIAWAARMDLVLTNEQSDCRHVVEVRVSEELHAKLEEALALLRPKEPDLSSALSRALDLLLADLRRSSYDGSGSAEAKPPVVRRSL